jgi:hypothetical protein
MSGPGYAGASGTVGTPGYADAPVPIKPEIPRMTISMLGAKNSGKSTYIRVLYNHIVSARYGYTLHADTDVRLRDNADVNTLVDGTKLQATGTEPEKHGFTIGALRNGIYTELVGIDLIDFRGEALLDLDVPGTDSAQLYQRIPKSDSIFVVFDATHFIEPIAGERAMEIAFATLANDISDRIADALAGHRRAERPAPSVVVLLSKVDVLDEQVGRPGRQSALVRDEICNLILPIALGMGSKTGFFPVSIGRYASQDEGDRLIALEPRGVAVPLFYALFWFLVDHQESLTREHGRLAVQYEEADRRRISLWRRPAFIRWIYQNAITRNHVQLDRLRAGLAAYEDRINAVSWEADALKRMLDQGP